MCCAHWCDRGGLYKQAKQKDKALAEKLADLEKNKPEEFVEHVELYGEKILVLT